MAFILINVYASGIDAGRGADVWYYDGSTCNVICSNNGCDETMKVRCSLGATCSIDCVDDDGSSNNCPVLIRETLSRTGSPTISPTTNPTIYPTTEPTASPTYHPTIAPTISTPNPTTSLAPTIATSTSQSDCDASTEYCPLWEPWETSHVCKSNQVIVLFADDVQSSPVT